MKKLEIKFIVSVLSISLVIINIYLGYRYLYDHKEVYFASKMIKSFAKIEKNDVIKKKIPTWLYQEYMVTDIDQLHDLYVDINTTIYNDMIIDKRMLINIDQRNNYSKYRLTDDEVIFSFTSDSLKDLRGLLVLDQCVDIYLSIDQKLEAPLVDWLFKNIRIIGIKDKYGKHITDIDEIPYLINLAIKASYLSYLIKARDIGDLQLFVTSDVSNQAMFNLDSELLKYLL
ncbi:MAG: hypothetical protein PHP11_04365 [Erysipelotrichaceae bacterium]|nr:hypothetical protein [Erysipelotrichaceae bacterium]MDD3924318.1 hypothetical protein [Erysipelotrichaceae bacterium]